MPNHVANFVVIRGDKHVIDSFWNNATTDNTNDGIFKFNNLNPIPENMSENWYDWNVNNWGTKWDCYDVIVKHKGLCVIKMYYDTAWSPAKKFWKTITKKYKIIVTNHYHDEGSGFCGYSVFQNGKIIFNQEHDDIDENKAIFIGFASICGRVGYYDDEDEDEEEKEIETNNDI